MLEFYDEAIATSTQSWLGFQPKEFGIVPNMPHEQSHLPPFSVDFSILDLLLSEQMYPLWIMGPAPTVTIVTTFMQFNDKSKDRVSKGTVNPDLPRGRSPG